MPNRQEVAQAQPAAVGHLDPRRQQDSVRAAQRTPRHLRGYRKQVTQFVMAPRPDERWVGLDPSEGATYTAVHQQAVAESGLSQRVQHSAMVLDRGGREMVESFGEISVDPLHGQVAGEPGQTLAEDHKLLPVAGGGASPSSVALGVVNQGDHFVYQLGAAGGGEEYLNAGTQLPPQKSATIPTRAPLAQLDSFGVWWGWATFALRPILSTLWVVSLALALLLHASGCAMTLVLLGQFGRARSELRKGVFPRRG